MRRLTIRNIGPIQSVCIDLKRINVLIGLQSSGKSTINKIACHCSWVEKEILLKQSSEIFEKDSYFSDQLIEFHKLEGFLNEYSFIEYETDFIFFSYSHQNLNFSFQWKLTNPNLQYNRTKTLYIPAERNIVAVIPNWFDIKLDNSNLRSFMSAWQEARNLYSKSSFPILNLDVTYTYNQELNQDELTLNSTSKKINFRNASSGLQSLIPLYTLIKYYTFDLFSKYNKTDFIKNLSTVTLLAREYKLHEESLKKKVQETIDVDQIKKRVLNKITSQETNLDHLEEEINTEINAEIKKIVSSDTFSNTLFEIMSSKIENFSHTDLTPLERKELEQVYKTTTEQQCSIFLEEPEVNLFPTTQRELVKYLIQSTYHNKEGRAHDLFITTHSPYILTTLNNLIYAYDCAKNSTAIPTIIAEDYWVNFDDVGVWFVKNGTIECILDQEERQIDATKIDEVSQLLNDEFDNLLNTQYHEV